MSEAAQKLVVSAKQFCEHLKPDGVKFAMTGRWSVMILSKRLTLSRKYVRIERLATGFRVDHGKYRELRRIEAAPL